MYLFQQLSKIILFAVVQIGFSTAVPTGIRRDTQVHLLDSERIVKRSINEEIPSQNFSTESKRQNNKTDIQKEQLEDISENLDDAPEKIVTFEIAEESENDDMDTAASGIVFRPLFTYRYQQIRKGRRTRSVYLPKTNEPKLSRTKRSVSSTSDDLQDDFMDTAESSIVFRPLFRYRQRTIQRRRRQ